MSLTKVEIATEWIYRYFIEPLEKQVKELEMEANRKIKKGEQLKSRHTVRPHLKKYDKEHKTNLVNWYDNEHRKAISRYGALVTSNDVLRKKITKLQEEIKELKLDKPKKTKQEILEEDYLFYKDAFEREQIARERERERSVTLLNKCRSLEKQLSVQKNRSK